MKSQHIDRARQAKAEAAGWAAMGHHEKVEHCLRVVKQEVWLARKTREWSRACNRVPVQVWVRPDYVAEVRALEAKLQRRERRKAGTAG